MPLKKRWKCAEPAYAERCEQLGANVSEERVKGTSTGFALRPATTGIFAASGQVDAICTNGNEKSRGGVSSWLRIRFWSEPTAATEELYISQKSMP